MIGTILIIYVGYTYKAIIIFILGMLIEDLCSFVYKYKSSKLIYKKERGSSSLKFFLNDQEYIIVIPDTLEAPKTKVLAISDDSSNKTNYILKLMGPSSNFFGQKISPKNIGLKSIMIWKDRKPYKFDSDDIIEFVPEKQVVYDKESVSDVSDNE